MYLTKSPPFHALPALILPPFHATYSIKMSSSTAIFQNSEKKRWQAKNRRKTTTKCRGRYRKLQEDMPLSASKIEDNTLASWCSASKQMSFISFYLLLPPFMSRRYMKLKEDMPLSAAKIEDDTLASWCSASKQMSFISLYLLLF